MDRSDKVPDALIEEMKELGLFGLTIPETYGGLGLDMTEEIEVAMRLGRTAPAFRSVFGTNIGIGSQGLVIDGTEEQKQRYLPAMASGALIGSFCLTEPELRLRCRRPEDRGPARRQRLSPERHQALHHQCVTRRHPDGDGPQRSKRVWRARRSAFIVEAKSPGIRLGQPERKMGQ